MSQNPYIVSVVTPFHNTNLAYFSRCVDSMVKQTIGFEKVEWVITLHNSEPEYVEAVHAMTAAWPNIRLFELYNDNRTASSPRNECLKHATGKYICFLDADDYYFPDCLEVAVRAMEDNNGDMGNFRTEMKRAGGLAITYDDVTLDVDQTQPVIVYHKGDQGIGRLFSAVNGAVWNKIFLREMLTEHNITFRDDIRLGEDVCFNMVCLKYVETYVVMPQHIGNVYFRNAGSLVESASAADAAATLQYLHDVYNWMRLGLDTGYDMSNLLWLPLTGAAKRLATPGIPPEKLEAIRRDYAELIPKLPPLRPSGKRRIFSQAQMDGMVKMVKAAFLQGDTAAASRSDNILWEILDRNKDTEMGHKYNFDTLKTYGAFSTMVPLSDYGFYAPLVELTTRLAENNIFCAEPVAGYALSSGTGGAVKRVPYTTRHLGAYASFLQHSLEGNDTLLLMGSLPRELEYKDHTYLDSISGAALRELKNKLQGASFSKRRKDGAVTSPLELLFPEETIDPRYARLLFALIDSDVTQILAPFTWTVLDTIQFLEKNWEQLTDDIENGCITCHTELPTALKDALQTQLRPDPVRAAELRELFTQGFAGIITRLWPKCHRIVAAGTGAFALYTRKLRAYCGDAVLSNGIYAASEAVIGQAVGDDGDEYRLLPDSAFFELLALGAEAPIPVEEAIPDTDYELIVTNAAGLYRYRLGDVIRVHRFENGVPLFTFTYRTEDCCRLPGLCLNGQELERLVRELENASGVDIRDFCAGIRGDTLTLYVEPAANVDPEALSALSSECAEQLLRGMNPAFTCSMELRVLQPETHLLYRDRRMFKEKTVPDQIKPVRVLVTEEQRKFFEALSNSCRT